MTVRDGDTELDGLVVMAVDAGVSTGVAIGKVHDDDFVLLYFDQFIEDDYIKTAQRLASIAREYKVETVVTERFDLRPGNKFLADLTTVQVNAAFRALGWYDDIVEQTPAQAKGLASDRVLKRLGWWVTGKQVNYKDANDVRDALRHLVYYGVRTLKLKNLTKEGWNYDNVQGNA